MNAAADTAAARARVGAAAAVVWVALPTTLALVHQPYVWRALVVHDSPLTWAQSIALALAAGGACGLGWLSVPGSRTRQAWAMVAAVLALLAVVEEFAVGPGEWGAADLVAGGALLVVAWVLWRLVGEDRWASGYLLAALGLGVVTLALDMLASPSWTIRAQRLAGAAEEIAELGATLALLALVVIRVLDTVAGSRATAARLPSLR